MVGRGTLRSARGAPLRAPHSGCVTRRGPHTAARLDDDARRLVERGVRSATASAHRREASRALAPPCESSRMERGGRRRPRRARSAASAYACRALRVAPRRANRRRELDCVATVQRSTTPPVHAAAPCARTRRRACANAGAAPLAWSDSPRNACARRKLRVNLPPLAGVDGAPAPAPPRRRARVAARDAPWRCGAVAGVGLPRRCDETASPPGVGDAAARRGSRCSTASFVRDCVAPRRRCAARTPGCDQRGRAAGGASRI